MAWRRDLSCAKWLRPMGHHTQAAEFAEAGDAPQHGAYPGDPVGAADLRMRGSIHAARPCGRHLPGNLLSRLRSPQSPAPGLPDLRSGPTGLSQCHREGRLRIIVPVPTACSRISRKSRPGRNSASVPSNTRLRPPHSTAGMPVFWLLETPEPIGQDRQ